MSTETQPEYDVDYFIAKFDAIPEEQWCVGSLYMDGRSCVLGHCGMRVGQDSRWQWTAEADALSEILWDNLKDDCLAPFPWIHSNEPAWLINDGSLFPYKQPTAKQRILAALRDIKAKQSLPPR